MSSESTTPEVTEVNDETNQVCENFKSNLDSDFSTNNPSVNDLSDNCSEVIEVNEVSEPQEEKPTHVETVDQPTECDQNEGLAQDNSNDSSEIEADKSSQNCVDGNSDLAKTEVIDLSSDEASSAQKDEQEVSQAPETEKISEEHEKAISLKSEQSADQEKILASRRKDTDEKTIIIAKTDVKDAEKESDDSTPIKTTITVTTKNTNNGKKSSGFFTDPHPLVQQRLATGGAAAGGLIAPLTPVADSPVDVPAYTCEEAQRLLKGKKVVYLGDSIQRAAYKDLVLLLQENRFMTKGENRARAHRSILNDTLLDGGEFGQLTNDPHYKEVREFVKEDYHVKFYFITRVWYDYLDEVMKSIEELKPDVVIACSMLWDIMRYGDTFLINEYQSNLDKFLTEIKKHVPETSAIIWANSPPVADRCYGGVFVKQVMNKKPYLKEWHLRAMKITKHLVEKHEVDMMDFLGYLYPYQSQLVKDGLHWSSAAHRYMTNIILRHVCDLWEAEGAKLAEKAVTRLEDYKHIYDDPDDAYLTDMQHLFDQQAVEAGHYTIPTAGGHPHGQHQMLPPPPPPHRLAPQYGHGPHGYPPAQHPHPGAMYHPQGAEYGYHPTERYGPPPPAYRRLPPPHPHEYVYEDSRYQPQQPYPPQRFMPEDPMLRDPAMAHHQGDPYYDGYGAAPPARAPPHYPRAPPRHAGSFYGDYQDPYHPYEGGYDDVYGGLPDSYLMPSYRVGAGYSNYPPRPSAVPHRAVPAGRWIADEQRATVGRSQYELARPLKRTVSQIAPPSVSGSDYDPYYTGPPEKKPHLMTSSTSAPMSPAVAAKLARTSAAPSASEDTSSSYQALSFEERYGGPVGKPMFW